MSAAKASTAVAPDSVNFINENDAGRVFLALLEKIAYAAGAHSDKHLDEVGTGNREKRNIGFAGDGPGKQRFTGAGRSDEQDAFGDAAAEFLELLRIFQEL